MAGQPFRYRARLTSASAAFRTARPPSLPGRVRGLADRLNLAYNRTRNLNRARNLAYNFKPKQMPYFPESYLRVSSRLRRAAGLIMIVIRFAEEMIKITIKIGGALTLCVMTFSVESNYKIAGVKPALPQEHISTSER